MKGFLRQIISVVLMCALLIVSIPSFAADEGELKYGISFDSSATNSLPSGLTFKGRGIRVCEVGEKNKALAFELISVNKTATAQVELSNRYFISFDISADGKFNGSVDLATAGGGFSLVGFTDGQLCSANGKPLMGIGRKMTNVAVEVDSKKSTCNIYVNGKSVAHNMYMLDFKKDAVTSLTFSLSSIYGSTVYIDNVNAGLGNKLKRYPTEEYSDSEVEYTNADYEVTNSVYYTATFEKDSRVAAAYNKKLNILERADDEEGNGVCLFKRSGTGDFHFDMTIGSYASASVVFQYDIKLMTPDVQMLSTFKNSSGKYFNNHSIEGTNFNSKTITVGKWHTLAIVYHVSTAKYDLYFDYEPLYTGLSVPEGFSLDEGSSWRLHCQRDAGIDYFHVDNVYIYGGEAPRKELDTSAEITINVDMDNFDTAQGVNTALLSDKVTYHKRSGVTYAKGVKSVHKPMEENGVTLAPLSFFETAFGSKVSYDSSTGAGVIDSQNFKNGSALSGNKTMAASAIESAGELYVPVKDVLESMGKVVTEDNTAVSGGMMVIDNKAFDLDSTGGLQALNKFALYERPNPRQISADYDLSELKGVHPRVIVSKEDFDRIKSLSKTDEYMKQSYDYIIRSAEDLIEDSIPLVYELRDGVRLLYVSYDMLEHMTVLGMAYQLTGEKKYADRAWIDLESVSKFYSWHPEHPLDVGAMSVAVAIGYDWMYDAFTPEQREKIEKGAYNNGFYEYVNAYTKKSYLMQNSTFNEGNHNFIMNAGSSTLGIAFMDVYPDISSYCIANSLKAIENAIGGFAPEGSWWEGVGYGGLALEYMGYQFFAIDKVFDTLYSVDASEGIELIPYFYLYMQSPMGCFSYADGGGTSVTTAPIMYWICEHFGDYAPAAAFADTFGLSNEIQTMLWYRPEMMNGKANLDYDRKYSDQQIVVMRDSWDKNSHSLFAGIKGGRPADNHGHMDVGKFEFFANGVQWTSDLGADDYNLPGYFDCITEQSPRWSYFRMRAEGHSTIFIDPDQYGEFDPNVKAMLSRYESKARGAIAVLDMTDTHMGKANKAQRAMMLADNRGSLVLRDEITLAKAGSKVYWHMITSQNAQVNPDGKSVRLSEVGNPTNFVDIEFASNTPFTLSAVPCAPLSTSPNPSGMADDTDKTIIRLELTGTGDVDITAKLTPSTLGSATNIADYNKPISTWTIPDGELRAKPRLDKLVVAGDEYPVSNMAVSHFVPHSLLEIPVVDAQSALYDVSVRNATGFDDYTEIKVSDKLDPANASIYRVYFKKFAPLQLDGYTECAIYKLTHSEQPQAENPSISAIDRNLSTRWSAENDQYLILDLGSSVEFDTLIMAFMTGNGRHYHLNVSVSDDGTNWREVFKGDSSGKTNDYEPINIGMQKARYVKVGGSGHTTVDGLPGSWNSWTEVAIAKSN